MESFSQLLPSFYQEKTSESSTTKLLPGENYKKVQIQAYAKRKLQNKILQEDSASSTPSPTRSTEMLPVIVFFLMPMVGLGNPRPSFNHFTVEGESEEVRSAAIKRLLEVFGMEDPPATPPQSHKQPPQYMLDLYNTVADVDGVTKDPTVLEGNTVRSFFDKLRSDQIEYLFNLTTVARSEKLLTAELHLFKLRPQASLTFNRHHFCQVNVYQVLDTSKMNISHNKKLVSSRLIPIHSNGWEVFTISQAIRTWTMSHHSNLGLLVTVRTLSGNQMDLRTVRFASGQNHHHTKQPMLVLFTDDGRRAAPMEGIVKVSGDSPAVPSLPLPSLTLPVVGHRIARSLDYEEDRERLPCQRLPLYVDFEEIGWSGWIVSPRGYNAYHCKGSCPFPLGQNMRPTNHATVQSIINALKLTKGIETPCCVPDKLFSINLLYFDDDENVVLKQYDDMVAGSCGCH
ncbi:bone morphogenetic protein 2-like [Astyanax mexicanus]|uniref:Bone morphogenetic protein 2-like n=1 Tax=Astyanax mexicanus TaxID=7994 RepID=A0A8T2M9L7_ASTMX|nr:bone morphogenetic protein 2-like [Astyanax mexicanus]